MIIDCARYHGGRRRDQGSVPLTEAAARCEEGGFVWLGLLEPAEDELAQPPSLPMASAAWWYR
jgi:magnesium transporter